MEARLSQENAQRISLSVLTRLLENLPAEKLAAMPADRFPESVPVEMIKHLPPDTARILEEKLLEQQAAMLGLRARIGKQLGEKGLAAFDLSQSDFSISHLEVLNARFQEYNAYKRYFDFEQEQDGAQRLLKLLEKEQDDAEDVRHDYHQLQRAVAALDPAEVRGNDLKDLINAARERLLGIAVNHEKHLTQYFGERLALSIAVMKGHEQAVNHSLAHRKKILRQAKIAADELSEDQRKLLSRRIYRSANEDSIPLQGKESVRLKLLNHELPYGETDLTHWMDVVVDYQLHTRQQGTDSPLLSKARKYLHKLLTLYFESTEITSRAVSSEERLSEQHTNLEKFELKSMNYLQGYLKQRQRELSAGAPN